MERCLIVCIFAGIAEVSCIQCRAQWVRSGRCDVPGGRYARAGAPHQRVPAAARAAPTLRRAAHPHGHGALQEARPAPMPWRRLVSQRQRPQS